MTTWHARYLARVGDKGVNTMVSNAGLGVTGAFLPRVIVVDWKPGEIVDVERAEKLLPVIKLGIEQEGQVCQEVLLADLWFE